MIDKGRVMSVKERLKNIATKNGKLFDNIFQMYLLERLLFRLSVSNYADNFVLKGGVLLFALYQNNARPTQDVDFSAKHLTNDMEIISAAFKEICLISCDDAISFDPESIHCVEILNNAENLGLRIFLIGNMGKAHKKIQIDIGFGDVCTKEIKLDYPVLLEDNECPVLLADSIETVVAEKFDAMLRHSLTNSRMKDFYDIFVFATDRNFSGEELLSAIRFTNESRATKLIAIPVIFKESFYLDMQRNFMWKTFLKRSELGDLSFVNVGYSIISFLQPVYQALYRESNFLAVWDNVGLCWEIDS